MTEASKAAPALVPCPHLPVTVAPLDFRHIEAVGASRGFDFYLRCLEYAQHLWCEGSVARAVLAIDRALGADLRGDEPELRENPLPYQAMRWVLETAPDAVFLGNPTVHFQHLADRVRGQRSALRSTRYWACWWLSRAVFPGLPGDPRHVVTPPSLEEVRERLVRLGLPGEAGLWMEVLAAARPNPNRPRFA